VAGERARGAGHNDMDRRILKWNWSEMKEIEFKMN
jgi:hypothetical protein